jgi:hypothetical protein
MPKGWQQNYFLTCLGGGFIGANICPGWHDWVVGNVGGDGAGPQGLHFVIEAIPFATSNDGVVANGPLQGASDEAEHLLGAVGVGRWSMHWMYVPTSGSIGSSIMLHHLALVWTNGKHTYAITFHVYPGYGGMALARSLDLLVARHTTLVDPADG